MISWGQAGKRPLEPDPSARLSLGSRARAAPPGLPAAKRAGGAEGPLTLLDVFRMGTSFSALILASRSSQARPVF